MTYTNNSKAIWLGNSLHCTSTKLLRVVRTVYWWATHDLYTGMRGTAFLWVHQRKVHCSRIIHHDWEGDEIVKNNFEWDHCYVVVCTDGAAAMEGKHTGLRTLIKHKAPHAEWTHCFIHREALVSKDLSQDLHEVLNNIVKAVNFIKTRPMKARFFNNCVMIWGRSTTPCSSTMRPGGCPEATCFLGSSERWRRERRDKEMRQFLEHENQTALADLFGQEDFL